MAIYIEKLLTCHTCGKRQRAKLLTADGKRVEYITFTECSHTIFNLKMIREILEAEDNNHPPETSVPEHLINQ